MKKGIPMALITGATGGLGRELAKAYVRKGFGLVLAGRDKHKLADTADDCDTSSVLTVSGDLTDRVHQKDLVSYADITGVSHLVIASGVREAGPLLSTSRYGEEIEQSMSLTAATMVLIRQMLPVLWISNRSVIVHINSAAGLQGTDGESIYAASKHAMTGFLEALRPEVIIKGIRILDVFPGAMKTKMMAHRLDYSTLINPVEAAEVIVDCATQIRSSLQVSELHLRRIQ